MRQYTQFLTAAPGTGLYNPTIQQFNPPTLQFTADNPVSGSTLTGLGTLTGVSANGQTCDASSLRDVELGDGRGSQGKDLSAACDVGHGP